MGQDVERASADDVLELLADASLVYNPSHEEAITCKLIEDVRPGNSISNAFSKQSGSDAGSSKLELYQWESDHVLDVYADARCGHDPDWRPPSGEENRAFCYTMESEMVC